jgi:predicted nucleic acid-binding protein
MAGSRRTAIYIDACLLIAVADPNDTASEEVKQATRELLLEVFNRKKVLVLSAMFVAECYKEPCPAEVNKLLSLRHSVYPVGISVAIARMAVQYSSTYEKLKAPDAIHLATAVSWGCSTFYTADSNILKIERIGDTAIRKPEPLSVDQFTLEYPPEGS